MEFLLNSRESLRDSLGFYDSFTEGFHGVADLELVGPDLEPAACEEGGALDVVLVAHNLMVSLQGEDAAATYQLGHPLWRRRLA